MVIHRRLRLASYRRADTGGTRRTSSRKHVLRTTGPYVYTFSLSPRLLLVSSCSFPLSFSSGWDAASVWQDWQVARSFRSARFPASNCWRKRKKQEREIERREQPRGSRRTTNEPYSPNPANSNRTESKESVCRQLPFSLSFSSLLASFASPWVTVSCAAPFPPPTEHLGGYPSRNSTKISDGEKRTFALPWNSSFNSAGTCIHTQKNTRK